MATPQQAGKHVDDAAPDKKGGKKKGLGKSGVRTKLVDGKKAVLTVQRMRRGDAYVVRVVHLEKEGAEAKTGMVSSHNTEAEAAKKFDDLVALAEKAGWKKQASSPKAWKSEFSALPQAAK